MKVQRINDERLAIKNLKNIRLVYTLQTLGIIGLLGYDLISNGLSSIKGNPLWLVFITSIVVLAFMSFGSSDERLALKNLQKIRVAFVIQLLGIFGILGYDLISKGMDGMKENPLWFVFSLSTLILVFLSMNISVDYEGDEKSAGKGLGISTIVLVLISISVVFFTIYLNETSTLVDGLLAGGILFICGFLSFLFLYGLRRGKE
ncbi:hypothetical protein GCM10028778_22210 [Barrientosiimonas marina]|uniref:Uncharacterized protein n=1 Tax=Lentibacillus kimchii TaxID=1542911 RepID=A0ABW2UT28_9BACI